MLTPRQMATVGMLTVSAKGDPANIITVALDTNPVPSGKHWIILAAYIKGIDAGTADPVYSGFFLCPPGTPSDPETNAFGHSIDLAIRPIRLHDPSFIDEVVLGPTDPITSPFAGASFHLVMSQPQPVIVPQQWFLRGLAGQVGASGSAQAQWFMTVLYIEEENSVC